MRTIGSSVVWSRVCACAYHGLCSLDAGRCSTALPTTNGCTWCGCSPCRVCSVPFEFNLTVDIPHPRFPFGKFHVGDATTGFTGNQTTETMIVGNATVSECDCNDKQGRATHVNVRGSLSVGLGSRVRKLYSLFSCLCPFLCTCS